MRFLGSCCLSLIGGQPPRDLGIEFGQPRPQLSEPDDNIVRVADPGIIRLAATGLWHPGLSGQLVNCLTELGNALNRRRTHDRIIRSADLAPRRFEDIGVSTLTPPTQRQRGALVTRFKTV